MSIPRFVGMALILVIAFNIVFGIVGAWLWAILVMKPLVAPYSHLPVGQERPVPWWEPRARRIFGRIVALAAIGSALYLAWRWSS